MGYGRDMRIWLGWWACLMGMVCSGLAAEEGPVLSAGPKKVYVVPIRDAIEASMVYLVRRGVKEAMAAEADLLVVDMDTGGGRGDSTEEIMRILEQFPGEAVTYVNHKAFSAGALISMATDQIYMAPQSVIGAAAPILMGPGGTGVQEMPDTVEVKMTSAFSALVRTSAQKHGHDEDVIMAMIDKHHELKRLSWSTNAAGDALVQTNLLCEKGQILTLTDEEARRPYFEEMGQTPRPLLSSGTIESLDALIDTLGFAGAERVNIEPTDMERLGAWLSAISPFLLMVGIIGLYIEFKTPGFGLPGIVGLLAIGLYFLSGYVAGLSGSEWIIVFFVGLALVVVEMFVLPGTLFIGLAGAALMLVAIVMALVDVYPNPGPGLPTIPHAGLQLRMRAVDMLIVIAGTGVGVWVLSRFLPKTSMYRTLVSQSAAGMATERTFEEQQSSRLGMEGVAISTLRPGGKAQFGEQILDVVTQGEMLEAGTRVRIIGSRGSDAVVEPMA